MTDYIGGLADLDDLSDRDLLILSCRDIIYLKERLSKIERSIEKMQDSPMCDDHEIRLTRIETTQRIAIGVLTVGLTVLIPVVIWLIDKVV